MIILKGTPVQCSKAVHGIAEVMGSNPIHYDLGRLGIYLTIILRNRAEYRVILSRRGRRPSRLKSDDIPRD